MAGVFPSEMAIYIVAANVGSSALAASDKISGEISNFSITGADQENEFKNLFGGQLEITKPRGNGEVSFDISASNTLASRLDFWDLAKFPGGLSNADSVGKCVYISAFSNAFLKVFAMNNAKVVVGETNMTAEDELQKTVTLRFAYATPTGAANLRTSTISGATLVGNASAFFSSNWTSA